MDGKLRAGVLALGMSFAGLAAPALGATPANKLDGHLQALVARQKPVSAHGVTPIAPAVTPGDRTLVDVYVNGDIEAAARQLRGLGMSVKAVSRRAPERMIEGYLPVDAATKVAALRATKSVLSVFPGVPDTGSVLSQGDAPQHGPQARALGATGAGVTVGVMSDSINLVPPGIAGSQASGDLPPTVTVLHDGPAGSDDEGRAMSEIVYDEAPGITNLLFDSGTTGGAAEKAANIADLVSHGAKVIADDISMLDEPFFQDGVVTQAADAANAASTAYIASAGNRARQSWEGPFTPGAGGLNNFGSGDTRQAVVDVPAGTPSRPRFALVHFQWDEPWGSAPDNFRISLRANNGAVISSCQGTSGIPRAVCGLQTTGSGFELELEISRVSGSGFPRLKYIANGNFGPFAIKTHATSSSAINPDAAAARGALAAAAVCWSTSQSDCNPFGPPGLTMPEVFSSRGPVVRTRSATGAPLAAPEVRQKPNVAGADGVSTDLALGGGLNPFFGTSAATPSVAGVAALALSANPGMTVDQLYALLTNPANALDCTSAAGVPDTDCGAGFIQADRVVTGAKTPPAVAAVLSPAAPDGANGWYRSPVAVSWQVTDLNPAALVTNGCGPATLTSDAITTLTCSATGAGGSRSGSVTIRHDASPPIGVAFSGIAAKAYKLRKVPKKSRITCTATDPTSGFAGCTFTGYSSKQGAHKLRATAANGAGLTSSGTLSYKVGCVVPKLKGKTLAKAKSALKKANCTVGKVKGRGVVKSSSPAAGKSPKKGTKVNLTLR
jgi:Subtilase family/PASTA domain